MWYINLRLFIYVNGFLGFDVWIIDVIIYIGIIGVSINNEVCCFIYIGWWWSIFVCIWRKIIIVNVFSFK